MPISLPSRLIGRLFAQSPARGVGARLYQAAVSQARQPALYAQMGAPDTGEGRFEVYSLHVALLLIRLRGQGAAAQGASQALFDAYVSNLDHGLREMGVGDLSVGKKMRRLGEAFYGRLRAYQDALDVLPEAEPLRALIARTVLAGAEDADPGPLADYAARAHAALAAAPLEDLLDGNPAWPLP
jgi:cytochrome b pre-mRNA-processing protein 3